MRSLPSDIYFTMRVFLRFTFTAALISLPAVSRAQERPQAASDSIAIIADEVTRLRHEVNMLKDEVARLRRLLSGAPEGAADTLLPVDDKPKTVSSQPATTAKETGYWLSTGGVRHNTKCRYYKLSAGRPCGPNEGKACKKCGG